MALATEKLYYHAGGSTYKVSLYTDPLDVGDSYLAIKSPNGVRYCSLASEADNDSSRIRVYKGGIKFLKRGSQALTAAKCTLTSAGTYYITRTTTEIKVWNSVGTLVSSWINSSLVPGLVAVKVVGGGGNGGGGKGGVTSGNYAGTGGGGGGKFLTMVEVPLTETYTEGIQLNVGGSRADSSIVFPDASTIIAGRGGDGAGNGSNSPGYGGTVTVPEGKIVYFENGGRGGYLTSSGASSLEVSIDNQFDNYIVTTKMGSGGAGDSETGGGPGGGGGSEGNGGRGNEDANGSPGVAPGGGGGGGGDRGLFTSGTSGGAGARGEIAIFE